MVGWRGTSYRWEWLEWTANYIDQIKRCISSISYVFDGKTKGCMRPTRGLREGDPMSPYLFLFCANGFSCQLTKALNGKRNHGVQIYKRVPEFHIHSLPMIVFHLLDPLLLKAGT